MMRRKKLKNNIRTDEVDKKKYPKLQDYLDALLKLKNKKALELTVQDTANRMRDGWYRVKQKGYKKCFSMDEEKRRK